MNVTVVELANFPFKKISNLKDLWTNPNFKNI